MMRQSGKRKAKALTANFFYTVFFYIVSLGTLLFMSGCQHIQMAENPIPVTADFNASFNTCSNNLQNTTSHPP